MLLFEIIVQEPSYASFEEQVEAARSHYERMNEEREEEESVMRNIHEGILRETSVGTMLEEGVTTIMENGDELTAVSYDFYFGDTEYWFQFESSIPPLSYEAIQQLLDEIMQTVTVTGMKTEVE